MSLRSRKSMTSGRREPSRVRTSRRRRRRQSRLCASCRPARLPRVPNHPVPLAKDSSVHIGRVIKILIRVEIECDLHLSTLEQRIHGPEGVHVGNVSRRRGVADAGRENGAITDDETRLKDGHKVITNSRCRLVSGRTRTPRPLTRGRNWRLTPSTGTVQRENAAKCASTHETGYGASKSGGATPARPNARGITASPTATTADSAMIATVHH